jgi:hypothetical protein
MVMSAKGRERVETGAGDHDLDGSELRAQKIEGRIDGSAVGDVGLRGDRGGAGLAQVLGGPTCRVALRVEQADAVAPPCQVPRDRQPHSRCRAGDHGDSTRRSHRSGCLLCVSDFEHAPGGGPFARSFSKRENIVRSDSCRRDLLIPLPDEASVPSIRIMILGA